MARNLTKIVATRPQPKSDYMIVVGKIAYGKPHPKIKIERVNRGAGEGDLMPSRASS